MFTLKYFLDTTNFIHPPKYLVKIDDDTYANVPRLWKILHDDEYSKVANLLMGSLFSKPSPIKVSPKDAEKQYTAKWVCPKYMYDGKRYPQILSGSAYVMTRNTAKCLYRAGLQLPFFHLEDVFLTGFSAEACGIGTIFSFIVFGRIINFSLSKYFFPERKHHSGFKHMSTKLKKVKSTDIMVHYRDLKGKLEIYNSGKLKFT